LQIDLEWISISDIYYKNNLTRRESLQITESSHTHTHTQNCKLATDRKNRSCYGKEKKQNRAEKSREEHMNAAREWLNKGKSLITFTRSTR
jgi:hypothetical protein